MRQRLADGARMSSLSLLHFAAGLLAVLAACVIFALPKGSRAHKVLGWTYVVAMGVSLVAILARTALAPRPFVVYAVGVVLVLVAAVAMSRARRRIVAWRAWHGALMALTCLAALMAMAGIFGGLALGTPEGPGFYRQFNVAIGVLTVAGLAFIASRPVIWGRTPRPAEVQARRRYGALVLASSAALVAAQWPMATG
jgi:uncharacterized membrane protein